MSQTTDIHAGVRMRPSNYGNFKKAAYTVPGQLQLVYSTLKSNESTKFESLKSSQVLIPTSGKGLVMIQYLGKSPKNYTLKAGSTVIVPPGLKHSILNTETAPLNLEIIYSPPLVASDHVQKTAPMKNN